ncbi:hypothetical protein [Schaalia vaccimaxillae]|uniref:hypothetical protein n=1 Tax=Schaalia vaccimaxillae TaxID=183916 RepID=UPI00041977C5|nr:hypothetical protein [Schaalia vaccimaxillae]
MCLQRTKQSRRTAGSAWRRPRVPLSAQRIVAASSDLKLLLKTLSRFGVTLQKSIKYAILVGTLGSGWFGLSPYEDITVLPAGHWISFDSRGMNLCEYSESSQPELTLDDALHALAQEWAKNCQIVADATGTVCIAHLTGGFDSRLVLAAMRSAGVDRGFSYYCSGQAGEPEFDSSRRLCASLSLTPTDDSGYAEENLSESWEEHLWGAFAWTEGVVSSPATIWGVQTPGIVLSGGGREILRSFYNKGESVFNSPDRITEHMFDSFAMGKSGSQSILSEPMKSLIYEGLENEHHRASEKGIRSAAQLDYLYLTGRNRYYVGEISRSFSRFIPRFDPLYSPFAAKIALNLDGEIRNSNLLGLRALGRLDSLLAALPFDSERYAQTYIDIYGNPARAAFRTTLRVPTPVQYAAQKPGQQKWALPQPTTQQHEFAKKLKMPPRLVPQFEYIQKRINPMLDLLDQSELSQVLDVDYLRGLIRKPPANRVGY